MTFSSIDDAFTALSSIKATQSDIIAFVRQLSVDVPGLSSDAVTVLYTGNIGDANAYEFVNKMPADIRRLDERTMATQVLNADAFKRKIAQAFGEIPDADVFDKLDDTHPAKLWMSKGGSGPWAVASEMFVEFTTDPIRFLAIDPAADSVLVQNEWKAALDRLGAAAKTCWRAAQATT